MWADQPGTQTTRPDCLPAGTRLSAPSRTWEGLVAGANVCTDPPDDDRDNVWWLHFTLHEAACGLEEGAVIAGYEDQISSLFGPASA